MVKHDIIHPNTMINITIQVEHLASILGADSRNNRIIIPNMDLRVAQESFTLRAANYWNQLPRTVRRHSKISNFKKHARSWILEKVEQFLD